MRSQTAYLVVLMVMMACFAVIRLNPTSVILQPGNLVTGASLLLGALVVAARWRYALAIGLLSAAVTALCGVLSALGVRGVRLPGFPHPLIWVVLGLYVAFRLAMNQQSERRARADRQTPPT